MRATGISILIFSLLALLMVSPAVIAQEIPDETCVDVEQQETCEEILPDNPETPVEEELIKGTPSIETVAGNEQIVTPPPQVLAATTTEEVATLEKTGNETIVISVVGVGIVLIAVLLYRIQKNEFYKFYKF